MSGVCLRNFNWGNALTEMFGVLAKGSDVFLLKIAPAGEETSIWQFVLRLGPSFSFFLFSFFLSFFLPVPFFSIYPEATEGSLMDREYADALQFQSLLTGT
jgi:hypothetical protein